MRGPSRLTTTADASADLTQKLTALTQQTEVADAAIRKAASPQKLPLRDRTGEVRRSGESAIKGEARLGTGSDIGIRA